MAGNGYLRTVNFGGFDKKDVLAYVDELNTKIYKLETDLKEKNTLIENGGFAIGEAGGNEEMQAFLDAEKAKNSELMAAVDTLKLQVSNAESEIQSKDEEIAGLKAQVEDLTDKLSTAESGIGTSEPSFDIGSVFIEAKNSADRIVQEAKKAASKMEADANELANQVLDDANNQAEKIITNAKSESEDLVVNARSQAEALAADAKAEAEQVTASTEALKADTLERFNAIAANIDKFQNVITEIFGDSSSKLADAKNIVSEAQKIAQSGANGTYYARLSSNKASEKNSDTVKKSVKAKPVKYNQQVEEKVKVVPPTPVVEQVVEEIIPEPIVEETIPEPIVEPIVEETIPEPIVEPIVEEAIPEPEAEFADEPVAQPTADTVDDSDDKKPALSGFDLDMLAEFAKEIEQQAGSEDDLTLLNSWNGVSEDDESVGGVSLLDGFDS